MKPELHIDLETFSPVDLKKSGVYKYVESPEFEILLFGYAFGNEPVNYVDLTQGDKIPKKVAAAIFSAGVTKTAWNAVFEMVCLEKFFGQEIDPSQWECTMVCATMVGLPASLDQAGLALKLDTSKDSAGKALITLFCKPAKLPKSKAKLTNVQGKLFVEAPLRNSHKTHPEKWEAFIRYLITDVEQERKIGIKIKPYVRKAFTPEERFIWLIDYKINRRGIMVDQKFTERCIILGEEQKRKCLAEAVKLTKLSNPNSTAQIKDWLEKAIGEPIESLNKKFLPGILAKAMDAVTERVIELRQELSKSSIKKFNSIMYAVCKDGRVKGLHRYFGAPKTGRWSSFIVQIHNLKKNDLDNLEAARELVYNHGIQEMEAFFAEAPQEILSQLIRTAFIAKPGHSLLPSDFSAIEARITAWLAGEKWRMDIFNTHGRIYEASAAQMFKVPIETISYVNAKGETVKGKNYPMRAKGKIGELALGFGGGLEALRRMGGEDMGLSDSEMTGITKLWRITSPAIVKYWKEIENCALDALRQRGREIKHKHGVSFKVESDILWLKLPSGRFIAYREPRIEEKWVTKLECLKETITYVGMEQTRQKLGRLSTYGGKLTENIVQGTARDLLAGALVRLDAAKLDVVLHVHDEVVPEVSDKALASSVIKINKIMAVRPAWAKDLPLTAETTVTKFYKK